MHHDLEALVGVQDATDSRWIRDGLLRRLRGVDEVVELRCRRAIHDRVRVRVVARVVEHEHVMRPWRHERIALDDRDVFTERVREVLTLVNVRAGCGHGELDRRNVLLLRALPVAVAAPPAPCVAPPAPAAVPPAPVPPAPTLASAARARCRNRRERWNRRQLRGTSCRRRRCRG